MELDKLFTPESIAVIGASTVPGKVGYSVFRNLIDGGYKGKLFPVNVKGGELLGHKIYKTLDEIEENVDLIVVVVPGKFVPATLEIAGKKGIRHAVVISAGFSEIGGEGIELEKELKEVIKKYNLKIQGPNCLGLMNSNHDMNATFASKKPDVGKVAILSQSGALCSAILDWSRHSGIGFSKFISVGNKTDLTESDMIEYLSKDDKTLVIMMYIEGLNDGRRFMEVASRAAMKKPLFALKSGRSEAGAKAASSHTGALSGADKIYDVAFNQSGVIRLEGVQEFFDVAAAFTEPKDMENDTVAIVTNAGGLGVMGTDAVERFGLKIAKLSEETKRKLREKLPREASVNNPVDLLGDALADRYADALEIVELDENVGSIVVILSPQDMTDVKGTAEAIIRFRNHITKPLVVAFVGGEDVSKGKKLLKEGGVSSYATPERAIRILSRAWKFYEFRKRAVNPEIKIEGDVSKAASIIEKVRQEGRNSLSEEEGYSILECYGIPTPARKVVTSAVDAKRFSQETGYPVVMKIASPDILHKSDVGGIYIAKTPEDVLNGYDTIMTNVSSKVKDARIDGITVQKMATGREILIGMARDPQFGPVITFGMGGVFVEVLKDISQRIAPLREGDSYNMLKEIHLSPIIFGTRGMKPLDIKSITSAIEAMSQIAMDFPEIEEMETNPILVGAQGEGGVAVDALIKLSNK